jgi:CheY-like chemotaxis protein
MEARKIIATLVGDERAEFGMFESAFRELHQEVEYDFVIPAEALEKMKDRRFDLVFIDAGQKPVVALQLLSVIKSDNRLKNTRVFMYGKSIAEELCKMARTLGASGCVEWTNCKLTFMRELKAVLDPRLLPQYVFLGHHAQNSAAPIAAEMNKFQNSWV